MRKDIKEKKFHKSKKVIYEPQKENILFSTVKETGYVKDLGTATSTEAKRRDFGTHLTSIDIFKRFIFPKIKDVLYEYVWMDLFGGEGNLILPILEEVPRNKRVEFFKDHILLFDIQKEMVEKAIDNAKRYGIPPETAHKNIMLRDTLGHYPDLKHLKYPPYHITNPPYLYLGYIAKHSERNLKYFSGSNEGYQDLYQIALINDLRNNIKNLIYIIPTNFLFGFSVSNKIRKDFFPFYDIKEAIIFERKIFEFTGANVCICFFEKKSVPSNAAITFKSIKINSKVVEKKYCLSPKNSYRAGGEFDDYVSCFKSHSPLKIKFYLTIDDIERNKGNIPIRLLDVNKFSNGYFKIGDYKVNQTFYNKLKNNPLFIRTLDTGSWEGRAGIYNVHETFEVDGILVTEEKYRTHPIQIFVTPDLSLKDTLLLKNYFNLMLEYFRDATDSEFLTTFKYSNSDYIRKYLGLSQAKKLIETFPVHTFSSEKKKMLNALIEQKNIEGIKDVLLNLNEVERQEITDNRISKK
ncbi:MAG TPA: N-6 DNA methylase [Verrucomicrobiota bacterium]|nr:N-6 DNA methylase [Verrucomicrobiota bacterium]